MTFVLVYGDTAWYDVKLDTQSTIQTESKNMIFLSILIKNG